jgi:hypothetical protein
VSSALSAEMESRPLLAALHAISQQKMLFLWMHTRSWMQKFPPTFDNNNATTPGCVICVWA